MPAHLRSLLTQNHLTFSVVNQCIVLGQWQGIYFFEHRTSMKNRNMQAPYFGR